VTGQDFTAAYRDRRVCVTGGAGFIGSHLVHALAGHGAQITVIDDLSNGRAENLDGLEGVRLHTASILDPAALAEALDGSEIVFHLAAVASVPRSVNEPALYFAVNAMGTQAILETARTAGASRVVYAASSSAYGDQPGMPRVETMPPDPRSPYAAAKCIGEHLVQAYARSCGLPGISLRYFNIFGPRQRPDSPYAAVMPRFADALLASRPAVIYGDGGQTRDFTHVANAVHANLLAGATARPLTGEIVNVACGRSASVMEILETMARLLGVQPAHECEPPRPGEVRDSLADVSLAREVLGYEPIVDLESGLRETVEHYRDALSP
jgi:UDP-glucose 4-epimerase